MQNCKKKSLPMYFSHHHFNQNMEDLWQVISDISLIPIIEDHALFKKHYPQISLSFNEQFRINISLDPTLKVFYQIESTTITDYCCTLTCKGYLSCSQLELFKSISTLHYISPERTLLIITYIFPYEYNQFIKEESQRRSYYNSIDRFIASKEHLKIHNDIRVIRGDIATGINCLLNFMSCLDLVFDKNNGVNIRAKIGMIINLNLNKAYMLNEKMNIITKLVKVERRKNYILIESYGYDKRGRLPYRYCHLEIFSEGEEEATDNGSEIELNGSCKERKFVLNFRHTFQSELDKKQLEYTKHYKALFFNKFEKIVKTIDERRLLKNIE